MNEIVLLESC